MKEQKKLANKLKTNKGITLIALVITVIVLLILAGVSISAITGNESAMNKAKEARTENEAGAELDSIKLAIVSAMSKGTYGMVEPKNLRAELTGLVSSTAGITDGSTGPWEINGAKSGRKYKIFANGTVEEVAGAHIEGEAIATFTDADTTESSRTKTFTVVANDGTVSGLTEIANTNEALNITISGTSITVKLLTESESGLSSSAYKTALGALVGNGITYTTKATNNGKQFDVSFTVKYRQTSVTSVESITVDPTALNLATNGTGEVTVTAIGTLGGPIALTASDISVSGGGGVATPTAGAGKVTVTAGDTAGSGTITISVNGKEKTVAVEVTANHTITYYANGGSDSMAQTIGAAPVVAACTFGAPTSGKKFNGWNTAENGTGTAYTVGTEVHTNLELYAQWRDKIEYSIGDSVTYTTTLNNQTLNTWRVFDKVGDYTYIILSDYMRANAVSSTLKTNYGLTTSGTYNVYSNSRENLINAMSTKSNWDELLTGTANGTTAVNETRTANVWAMGAPDLDTWVHSWNESYGTNDTLYTDTYSNKNSGSNMSDGLDGYYVGTSSSPSSIYVDLSSKTGYTSATDNSTVDTTNLGNLYFPHKSQTSSCYGHWLASPSANSASSVMLVSYRGNVSCNNYNSNDCAFRPVVCLPSSVLE